MLNIIVLNICNLQGLQVNNFTIYNYLTFHFIFSVAARRSGSSRSVVLCYIMFCSAHNVDLSLSSSTIGRDQEFLVNSLLAENQRKYFCKCLKILIRTKRSVNCVAKCCKVNQYCQVHINYCEKWFTRPSYGSS